MPKIRRADCENPARPQTALCYRAVMSRDSLLRALRSQIARAVTEPSTVRGKGNAGVAAAARVYLTRLDLAKLAAEPEALPAHLDQHTVSLLETFQGEAHERWGLARKILNLFLRDAVYNVHLRKAYRLATLERHLELPLDGETAKRVRRDYRRLRKGRPDLPNLPAWKGPFVLTPRKSRDHQQAALEVAQAKGLRARVHLDAFFWALERDEPGPQAR